MLAPHSYFLWTLILGTRSCSTSLTPHTGKKKTVIVQWSKVALEKTFLAYCLESKSARFIVRAVFFKSQTIGCSAVSYSVRSAVSRFLLHTLQSEVRSTFFMILAVSPIKMQNAWVITHTHKLNNEPPVSPSVIYPISATRIMGRLRKVLFSKGSELAEMAAKVVPSSFRVSFFACQNH